jgi:hypothetical protein
MRRSISLTALGIRSCAEIVPERTFTILAERIPPDRLTIDCRRPQKLYRYSNATWLERSLKLGEFRLRPAADYKDLLTDRARNDDELVRVQSTEGKYVTMTRVETGQDIKPIGQVSYRSEIHTNYLVSCFSCVWDPSLFDEFSGSDACLVIHKVDEFCERMHLAAEAQLPGCVGIDGPVTYGGSSPLGAVFSKPLRFLQQQEWRFACMPKEVVKILDPKLLSIGSIEVLAELRLKDS